MTLPKTTLSTVTAYGRSAGSARVRVFDWLDHLGLEARSSTYLGNSRNSLSMLVRDAGGVVRAERGLRRLPREVGDSTVLLSRQASPFSNGGIERRILSTAARGVYDFDDALMHTPGGLRESVWSKKRAWEASVRAADIVIAGNAYLAERAAQLNENTVVIPSCVAADAYGRKTDYAVDEQPRAVWIGSPSGEQYLAAIAAPLLALHRARGLRLRLVSSGSASLGALDEMTDRVEWSAEAAGTEMQRADVGIMPLDDTPWTRGKCAYKLLEYGAAGLPMVGSPVGANTAVLETGDGLQPTTGDDWFSALDLLLTESTERRASRGASARRAVEQGYTFDVWSDVWRSALGLPQVDRAQADPHEGAAG